jgi:folate-binding protein YgfZ
MLLEYYEAATKAAAVVEQDWLGSITLTSAERASWLQGMVTNEVEKLKPGHGCYAAHLNAQGRVIAQMMVLVEADAIRLVLERATVAKLLSAFDKLIIMEDVLAQDVSESNVAIGVLGPNARSVLESWLGEPLNLSERYEHRRIRDVEVVLSDLGYDVWVRRDHSDNALREISEHGATAIDHGVWDVIRTEAGLPIYGVDIDESTTMPELGERGISYDKGCYIGQEVVARVKYIGHVNRRFVGIVAEGQDLPEIRTEIRKDGKDVGYVTTSLFSPGLGKPVALGFVNRGAATAGTGVHLIGQESIIPATVIDLPFIPRAV